MTNSICKNCGGKIKHNPYTGFWDHLEPEPGYFGPDGFFVICGQPTPSEEPTPSFDPALSDHLAELADLANQIGAQGIWLIRGATNARLVYEGGNLEPPEIPNALVSVNYDINLDIADTGIIVIMRFPSDGKEPGIEAR